MRITVMIIIGAVTFIGACTDVPTADRVEGGRQADDYADVTDVTIYRNVDNVPNVANFCAGGEEYAATLSVDGTRSPELIHLGSCTTKRTP